MQRREFLRLLSIAAAAGASLRPGASAAQAADELYELPAFGNVSLLHMTDSHAQLLPVYFREPVGADFGKRYGLAPGSARAHAFTQVDFVAAARRYGKVGGYAHLATLVKRIRASRPHALLLDGGDTWQGSATALWTEGADMIGAQKRLGVDAHDRALGVHLRREARAKGGRGRAGGNRVPRAEREDARLRGSRCSSPTRCAR
jgi:S-sulfosulfanyl-L-cysteine sulfohydrolase